MNFVYGIDSVFRDRSRLQKDSFDNSILCMWVSMGCAQRDSNGCVERGAYVGFWDTSYNTDGLFDSDRA